MIIDVQLPQGTRVSEDWADLVMRLRTEAGLSRGELAKLTEIDVTYVAKIERNGFIPHPRTIQRIARVIGIDIIDALRVTGYLD